MTERIKKKCLLLRLFFLFGDEKLLILDVGTCSKPFHRIAMHDRRRLDDKRSIPALSGEPDFKVRGRSCSDRMSPFEQALLAVGFVDGVNPARLNRVFLPALI